MGEGEEGIEITRRRRGSGKSKERGYREEEKRETRGRNWEEYAWF